MPDVPPANLHELIEAVYCRASSGHPHKGLLDIDAENSSAAITAGKDQGDDPAPRAQIDQIFSFSKADKMCEEEGIEGKSITFFLLNDPEATPEDLIERLV